MAARRRDSKGRFVATGKKKTAKSRKAKPGCKTSTLRGVKFNGKTVCQSANGRFYVRRDGKPPQFLSKSQVEGLIARNKGKKAAQQLQKQVQRRGKGAAGKAQPTRRFNRGGVAGLYVGGTRYERARNGRWRKITGKGNNQGVFVSKAAQAKLDNAYAGAY